MTFDKAILFLPTLAAAFLSTEAALADISLGAFGGHGLPVAEDGDDPFRWGFGGRAGFTIPVIPIYLGAAATLHTGSEQSGTGATSSLGLYGAEAGLDFDFDGFGFKGYAMVGAADLESYRDKDGGYVGAYVGLGLLPSVRFIDLPGADFYLGLDARYVQLVTATRADGEGDAIEEKYFQSFPLYLTLIGRFL
jgi:hypothetical protein